MEPDCVSVWVHRLGVPAAFLGFSLMCHHAGRSSFWELGLVSLADLRSNYGKKDIRM